MSMNHLHVKYLLVGGGLAGASAARAIRELDHEGSVLLVAQESSRPYHRPPLSKEYLRRQKRREALFAVEANWFEANHVELRTGRRVSRLDTVRRSATLDNGEEISFDKLLLATGASPAPLEVPGADLPNVFYLRTIEDVARLHNAIDKAKHEGRPHPPHPARPAEPGGPVHRGRAVVVGAGVLGVEVAASLTQMGLAVDLLASREHPWDKFAGQNTGKFLQLYLERHGVAVHPSARPLRVEGDGRVQRVIVPRPGQAESPASTAGTSSSSSNPDSIEIPCDFLVACVGAAANKDVLRGTPIAAGKAILVDEHCRTNVPDVYAAGDCCALLDPLFGKHRQMDHWDNAQVTGALAGRNMAGAGERYGAVNTFFSDAFDLTLNAWGEAKAVDRRLVRGSPRAEPSRTDLPDVPELVEIGVAADGRVAQVLALAPSSSASADEQTHAVLRELVARRLRLDGNEERLKDPTFPLADLLR